MEREEKKKRNDARTTVLEAPWTIKIAGRHSPGILMRSSQNIQPVCSLLHVLCLYGCLCPTAFFLLFPQFHVICNGQRGRKTTEFSLTERTASKVRPFHLQTNRISLKLIKEL